jgi:hypothetical protein
VGTERFLLLVGGQLSLVSADIGLRPDGVIVKPVDGTTLKDHLTQDYGGAQTLQTGTLDITLLREYREESGITLNIFAGSAQNLYETGKAAVEENALFQKWQRKKAEAQAREKEQAEEEPVDTVLRRKPGQIREEDSAEEPVNTVLRQEKPSSTQEEKGTKQPAVSSEREERPTGFKLKEDAPDEGRHDFCLANPSFCSGRTVTGDLGDLVGDVIEIATTSVFGEEAAALIGEGAKLLNNPVKAIKGFFKKTPKGVSKALDKNTEKFIEDVTQKCSNPATKGDKIHKNSHDYIGDTHKYRIHNEDGIYKVGQSAQGVRKSDGKSIRAESQARNLRKETGQKYETEITEVFPNKRDAYRSENEEVLKLRQSNPNALPGNKGNH